MEANIRPAVVGDIAAVRGIYAPYVQATAASFETEVPDLAEMERRFWSVTELGLTYLVAEVEGRVAGFASVTQFRSRAAYRYTVESSVYVKSEMTREGIGSRLLEELLVRCKAAGYRQVVAAIGGDNPASVALHARAGFRSAGTLFRVGYKLGEWQDLHLMQKEI
jgi:phosphinothricin acetyltransferase